MKVIESTGLVPVKANKRMQTRGAGEIFGVPPDVAITAVLAGDVSLYPVPEGVATFEFPSPFDETPESEGEDDTTDDVELVDIPEAWESLHHLKIIQLAEKISGKELAATEDKKVTEIAREVILAELEKRKASEA